MVQTLLLMVPNPYFIIFSTRIPVRIYRYRAGTGYGYRIPVPGLVPGPGRAGAGAGAHAHPGSAELKIWDRPLKKVMKKKVEI